ncbi:MAG: phenylalanine 4-monooxygenase [Myxococcota bacterium]|nr:phenylalanine 4-monooxygenase [Myxococcota bacterium]
MDGLPHLTQHAGGRDNLVALDPNHPGFQDDVYRRRRDIIAQIALDYRTGQPVPEAPYTEQEHAVWRHIWQQLAPLHTDRICTELLELQQVVPLPRDHIPQLATLNPQLMEAAGFRMEPVAGLVSARVFLRYLGQRVFLSTQYIRHHSRPLYTPEPDVVHELTGHVATLIHPGIAELNRLLGLAAAVASDAEMQRLERVYWYTLEFGVVEERGALKAFGAGLLSSCGELAGFDCGPTLADWNLNTIAQTPYDPTAFQSTLFVAPSFTRMLVDVTRWVRSGGWRA